MKIQLLKYFIFSLYLSSGFLYAQKYPFRIYTADDGFPPFAVESIIQDHLGNMWFTTQGGLVLYNGKRFAHFTMHDGLGHDFCRPIVEDRNHRLWIGTLGGGLTRAVRNEYGEYTFSVISVSDGLSDNSVLSLAGDSSGSLWIGTKNGICRLSDPGNRDTLLWSYYLMGRMINHLYIGRDQSVWCGDVTGMLYRIRNGKTDSLRVFGAYSSGISGMTETVAGNYHITSYNNGARQLIVEPGGYRLDSNLSEPNYLSRRIFGLHAGRSGRLLIATRGDGLLVSDGHSLRRVTVMNGLPEDQLACVYEDRFKNIWIGTISGRLCKWPDFPVLHYDEESGLSGSNILSVIQDRKGNYWFIPHENGLVQFDGNKWTQSTTRQGLPTNSLYTIYEDSRGMLWISTFGMGLVRFDGKRFSRFHPEFFKLNDVLCITEDSDRNLWFGTDVDGVVRYRPNGQLDVFNMANGLAGQRVLAIREDTRGNIWFGCAQPTRMKEAGGLCMIRAADKNADSPLFVDYNPKTGLASRYVSAIHETGDGALWLATRYHGLARLFHDTIKYYTVNEGLPSNTITGIAEDSLKRLWIGTVKGLALMAGEEFRIINRNHGLFSDEINENAVLCDDQGSLWIGVPPGVTAYRYQIAGLNPSGISLYADHIRIRDRLLPFHNLFGLTYDQNHLSFEMTGIDHRYERGIRYQYYLEGFDSGWSEWTERDYINYTNLNPGKYRLQVRAMNVNHEASGECSMAFTIHPAFWQTLWFRLGALAAVVLLSVTSYNKGLELLNRYRRWRRKRYIAHYKILAVLEEGAMGIVYRARDRISGKDVALKVIHPKLMSDEENKKRFERELRIMSSLDHPNIVRVHSAGHWQGTAYLAMEILDGGTLKMWMQSRGSVGTDSLSEIILQIADGLAYIHEKGIIHRDLKSENIMLTRSGVPKIMDFGLSKSALMGTITHTGASMGTLGYISPEQITGLRADERSDIFSFGVILYELVAGRLPFSGDNEIALIHSVFHDEPVHPSRWNPHCPTHLEIMILKCLKKDPDQRYRDMTEILKELRTE